MRRVGDGEVKRGFRGVRVRIGQVRHICADALPFGGEDEHGHRRMRHCGFRSAEIQNRDAGLLGLVVRQSRNSARFKHDGVLAGFGGLGHALLKRAGRLRAKDREIRLVRGRGRGQGGSRAGKRGGLRIRGGCGGRRG
ncbi:hypothetical protein SDC9_186855 [bioreactor metagenome]|uniref:Uncharacterized protein n=1 Tax=bioreactor metagenome TaxID=1076179 RepID=A0A645HK17_9ZZZZ